MPAHVSPKKILSVSLRWFISILALFLVFRNIDTISLLQTLEEVHFHWFWALVLVTIISWYTRIWRLKVIITNGENPVSFFTCFQGRGIEVFVNLFMPLRGGDVLRCVVLSKLIPNSSFSGQVGYYAVEKYTELLSLLAVVIICLNVSHIAELSPYKYTILWCTILVLIGGIGVVLLSQKWANKIPQHSNHSGDHQPLLQHIVGIVTNVTQALRTSCTKKTLGTAVWLSLALRIFDGMVFYILLQSMSFNLDLFEAILITALVSIGFMIPAAPGYIGTYELIIVYNLQLFGIGHESALGFALLSHAWMLIVWLLVGGTAVLSLPKHIIKHENNRE